MGRISWSYHAKGKRANFLIFGHAVFSANRLRRRSMALNDDEANAELEKLQQNITLTLQAIDQNFARCHQIVTADIIPHLDRFTDASRSAWDGSKVYRKIV